MVISKLLADITPDDQFTWTIEQAQKEMEGFNFLGPGWYSAQGSWMLIIGTDTPDFFIFLVFYDRDPRLAYQAIAMARVNSTSEAKAIQPTEVKSPVKLVSRAKLIYWGGIAVLWGIMLVVGGKWGFRAEVPLLILMLLWPYGIRKFLTRNKEPKHDA